MIGILGYGLEWTSTYTFLTQKQWISPEEIIILDEKIDIKTPEWVKTSLWPACYDTLTECDEIRKSPGITHHIIRSKLSSVNDFEYIFEKLTSQTQYFMDHYNGVTIWVTGTKGKSMISTVLHLTLQDAGLDVEIVGNIGKPVFDIIDFEHQPAYVVYEISSYMLESLWTFHLDVGVFNTLYPTHIAEHDGYKNYIAAKWKLVENSDVVCMWHQAHEGYQEAWFEVDQEKIIIYGEHWDFTFTKGDPCGLFWSWDEAVCDDEGMLILWHHTRTNFCSIVGICTLLGIDAQHFKNTITSFWWLPHRLENIGTYHDIIWINDAIATTPQATIAAIETFGDKIDTLLYGGIEWTYDHSWVIELIQKHAIKNLVLFPDSWQHILAWLGPSEYEVFETRDMAAAVAFAKQKTQSGKIVLLSCGSPSFSCWSGYVEKGELFRGSILSI